MNRQLPVDVRSAGYLNPHHNWWLSPVSVKNRSALIQKLQEMGFNATASTSQLYTMPGEADTVPECAEFIQGTVFLPVYENIPDKVLDKMASVLHNHLAPD